jgi:hypothetical protein
LRATPPFVWQLPTCCFSPINSMKNEKPLVLESNTPPLICYESHLYKQWGFLDCSQLLKIKLNGNLPINDTTKAHGICECYHIVDSCITDKRSWSSWLLVLWVPFTLQIGPLCDTNLFPSVLVWIAHSIAFINQFVVCPLSKFQMLTGAVVWTLVIVQCFECGILVAEWLASASTMAAFWRQAKEWIGCAVVPWVPINCNWH